MALGDLEGSCSHATGTFQKRQRPMLTPYVIVRLTFLLADGLSVSRLLGLFDVMLSEKEINNIISHLVPNVHCRVSFCGLFHADAG